VKTYEFTVVCEKDEDGRIVAICPALQGCYTDGETEAEALGNIKSVIRLHIKDRIANGEAIAEEVGVSKIRIAV